MTPTCVKQIHRGPACAAFWTKYPSLRPGQKTRNFLNHLPYCSGGSHVAGRPSKTRAPLTLLLRSEATREKLTIRIHCLQRPPWVKPETIQRSKMISTLDMQRLAQGPLVRWWFLIRTNATKPYCGSKNTIGFACLSVQRELLLCKLISMRTPESSCTHNLCADACDLK